MKFLKKKMIFSILCLVLMTMMLTACAGQTEEQPDKTESNPVKSMEKLNIVCTAYPQYDWVMQMLGENKDSAKVVYLLKNGVDMHSYQPSAEDMITISDCDLLIYVGGQSDQWIKDILKNSTNQNQKTIDMMELLENRIWEEEIIEGMQEDSHKENETVRKDGEDGIEELVPSEGEKGGLEELEYDEHVWLSLKNAKLVCEEIANSLGELDPDNQVIYEKNKKTYEEKLNALDEKYQQTVDTASQKTILVADRFPFRYLTEDYGLNYYAAFVGCSAETEASFDTIAFLASKVDSLKLPVIYQTETSDDTIARTVVNSTASKDQKIFTLDSMQSVTQEEIDGGICYLTVMENNLEMLKQGLQTEE